MSLDGTPVLPAIWNPRSDSNAHFQSITLLLVRSQGGYVGIFGGQPRIRTEKLLFLRQKGIPIPFNRPIVWMPE